MFRNVNPQKKEFPERPDSFIRKLFDGTAHVKRYWHTVHTNYAGMPINMLASLELHFTILLFFRRLPQRASFNIPCIRIFQSLIIIKSINCKNWVTPMYNVIRQKFVKGTLHYRSERPGNFQRRRRDRTKTAQKSQILYFDLAWTPYTIWHRISFPCWDSLLYIHFLTSPTWMSTSLRRRSADHLRGPLVSDIQKKKVLIVLFKMNLQQSSPQDRFVIRKSSFSNPVFVHGLNTAENHIINMHENEDILDRYLQRNLFLWKIRTTTRRRFGQTYWRNHISNFKHV